MTTPDQYRIQRSNFYGKINNFWPDMYGSEYSLYNYLPVSNELINQIRSATKDLGHIFSKTSSLIRNLDNESLIELGFSKDILMYIKTKSLYPETIISRFDFVYSNEKLKLLEFNSDTPTFIKECYEINKLICDHFKLKNPNTNLELELSSAINKAIFESIKLLGAVETPNIIFTAHRDNIEDWYTSEYLRKLCKYPSGMVHIGDLTINNVGLFDNNGNKIDVLYRQTYPIEYLINDIDSESNENVGLQLLELVNQRKLAIINPLSAFLLQPKTIQALIWGLAEHNQFYTDDEINIIKTYMLPTYLENDNFIGKSKYVKKPSLGREGDTVTIFNENNEVEIKNNFETYDKEIPIFQEYVNLPETELITEKGNERLSYIFGSFLIAGRPGAIGIRAGAKITANDSYFLPISVK
jgi:glutathionylspermidine synthase